ncbi:MAG: hypothetical protein HRU14_17725 [Planctomycetes bacterium]|nr:hypothetical protein [Planctomycetota bacterium]
MTRFKLPCPSADVKLYFHSATAVSPPYRKHGPTTPGDPNTNAWYSLPAGTGSSFGSQVIGGKSITTVEFTLEDGVQGDDTGSDGKIVDPGGPSTLVAPSTSIPTLGPTGLAGLAVLLAGAGLRLLVALRRRRDLEP